MTCAVPLIVCASIQWPPSGDDDDDDRKPPKPNTPPPPSPSAVDSPRDFATEIWDLVKDVTEMPPETEETLEE